MKIKSTGEVPVLFWLVKLNQPKSKPFMLLSQINYFNILSSGYLQ